MSARKKPGKGPRGPAPKPPGEGRERVSVSLPGPLVREARAEAERRGVTLSGLVQGALRAVLDARDPARERYESELCRLTVAMRDCGDAIEAGRLMRARDEVRAELAAMLDARRRGEVVTR